MDSPFDDVDLPQNDEQGGGGDELDMFAAAPAHPQAAAATEEDASAWVRSGDTWWELAKVGGTQMFWGSPESHRNNAAS